MTLLSKEALLGQQGMPEEDVELPGVGTVRVRALSRSEVMLMNKTVNSNNVLAMEQALISKAMVEPALTKEEVAQWQKVSPMGQMQSLVSVINRLSGMGDSNHDPVEEADKSIPDES